MPMQGGDIDIAAIGLKGGQRPARAQPRHQRGDLLARQQFDPHPQCSKAAGETLHPLLLPCARQG